MKPTNTNKTVPRRHCCQSGCDDCPFDFKAPFDPEIPKELEELQKEGPSKNPFEDLPEVYEGDIPEEQSLS